MIPLQKRLRLRPFLLSCSKQQSIDSTIRRNIPAAGPGPFAQFDAVITHRSVDRDGDELLPDGRTLDPSMALLWQHDATNRGLKSSYR
jgi:hypothetical protein